MKGYKTSKDYKRLEELLNKGYEVVCFHTYDIHSNQGVGHKPKIVTVVCQARLIKCEHNRFDTYRIRGVSNYILTYWPNEKDANDYESFADACEEENIEFIDITEE